MVKSQLIGILNPDKLKGFWNAIIFYIFTNKISTKDALVFDVRTTEEFNLGHIKGSINIDFYDEKLFVDFFQKINKTKPIYIYCRSGNRSKKSSEILKKIGFVKVYDLLGGYKNWIKNSN